jgi:hypothetical protein
MSFYRKTMRRRGVVPHRRCQTRSGQDRIGYVFSEFRTEHGFQGQWVDPLILIFTVRIVHTASIMALIERRLITPLVTDSTLAVESLKERDDGYGLAVERMITFRPLYLRDCEMSSNHGNMSLRW